MQIKKNLHLPNDSVSAKYKAEMFYYNTDGILWRTSPPFPSHGSVGLVIYYGCGTQPLQYPKRTDTRVIFPHFHHSSSEFLWTRICLLIVR